MPIEIPQESINPCSHPYIPCRLCARKPWCLLNKTSRCTILLSKACLHVEQHCDESPEELGSWQSNIRQLPRAGAVVPMAALPKLRSWRACCPQHYAAYSMQYLLFLCKSSVSLPWNLFWSLFTAGLFSLNHTMSASSKLALWKCLRAAVCAPLVSLFNRCLPCKLFPRSLIQFIPICKTVCLTAREPKGKGCALE